MSTSKEYYYNLLSKDQQKAYYAIKEGLLALKDSFQVPMLSQQEYIDIYFLIRLDHPEIFWSVTFGYQYYSNSSMVELKPKYFFTKDKIKSHQKAMESRIKKLSLQASSLDEKGKELFIHDFICQNVKYDKLKKEYSHEIIGALGNGVAVCEGISKAVKILCDALGLWCIIVISDSNPEKGIKYRHAWNLIKINGQYYHFDATFDNTLSKEDVLRHDYVNLSDKKIYRDHEPSIWKIPACTDNDNFYYKEKKISWTTLDEVRNRTGQAVRKDKPLLFHWRGGYLTNDIINELLDIFDSEASKKGKTAHSSINLAQAVFCVRFTHEAKQQAIEVEIANEGELYAPEDE